ncbi:dTDP-3-amino-3,6-dideoxy-alpha-D-galactopyranose 3-N-acetyltransferase [compost metagenome]
MFVGPNVTFTNDLIPRSKQYPEIFSRTLLKKGASIGANATIIAGNTIGAYAFIGAGSVVTKDIPDNFVFFGNPAVHRGYITNDGILLDMDYKDKNGQVHSI